MLTDWKYTPAPTPFMLPCQLRVYKWTELLKDLHADKFIEI